MPRHTFALMLGSLLILSGTALGQELEPANRSADPLPPGAIARLGSPRLLHPAEITSLVFSPDGRHLASGDRDGLVCLWETAAGRLLHRLQLKDAIRALAFSRDGRLLACGDASDLVIFQMATGKLLDSWPISCRPQFLIFLDNPGRLLAVGAWVECFDLTTGRQQSLLPEWRALPEWRDLRGAYPVASDGKVLAVTSHLGIDLWEIEPATKRWSTRDGQPLGLHVTPDGKGLLSLEKDGKVRRRSLLTGEVETSLELVGVSLGFAGVCSSAGGWMVVGNSEGRGRTCLIQSEALAIGPVARGRAPGWRDAGSFAGREDFGQRFLRWANPVVGPALGPAPPAGRADGRLECSRDVRRWADAGLPELRGIADRGGDSHRQALAEMDRQWRSRGQHQGSLLRLQGPCFLGQRSNAGHGQREGLRQGRTDRFVGPENRPKVPEPARGRQPG